MSDIDYEYPDFSYEEYVAETDKAHIVKMYRFGKDKLEEVVLPKSQTEIDKQAKTFNIPRWLAEKKELI